MNLSFYDLQDMVMSIQGANRVGWKLYQKVVDEEIKLVAKKVIL